MRRYQGESVEFMIRIQDDDHKFLPSLEDYSFKAVLTGNGSEPIRFWSTEEGTIVHSSYETEEGDIVGYASFCLTGKDTAGMEPTTYNIAVARVDDAENDAIDIIDDILTIAKSPFKKKGVK